MEVQEDGRIKASFQDFKKLYEKNNKCKITDIKQIGNSMSITYKRNGMYFIQLYPSHLLQKVDE